MFSTVRKWDVRFRKCLFVCECVCGKNAMNNYKKQRGNNDTKIHQRAIKNNSCFGFDFGNALKCLFVISRDAILMLITVRLMRLLVLFSVWLDLFFICFLNFKHNFLNFAFEIAWFCLWFWNLKSKEGEIFLICLDGFEFWL